MVPDVVLIVEDEEEVRFVLSELLMHEGFTVEQAADGFEALEAVALRIPAVILSDLRMPRMNGVEMARELKAHPLFRDIPILLLSALPPSSAHDLRLFSHVLSKPAPLKILVEHIRNLLG